MACAALLLFVQPCISTAGPQDLALCVQRLIVPLACSCATMCTMTVHTVLFFLSIDIFFFLLYISFVFSKRACAYACLRDGGSNINRGLHRGDQVTPSWSAQRPNNQLPNAGLPLINGSEHFLIFTPDSRTDGTYSHGAQIER